MKKLITICAALLMTASVWAQAPEKMSYQAVVRNTSNTLVVNQAVGMQITILQGSATGNPVYVETQTPTTNANGLVSLEIGSGILVSGDFTTIDWANDTYFIKTETDPTGGTTYTITGTTQLMSVPYALYAKESGSSTPGPQGPAGNDGVDGVDGIDGAVGATGSQGIQGIAGNDGAVGPQGPIGLTGPAGNDGVDGNDGAVGATGGYPVRTIGESYGGGIVFYVYDGGQHGLIAATADQSTGIRWYGGTNTNTRARADGIGAGLKNTAIIIANQGSVGGNAFAATVCNEYSVTVGGVTYGDWYLPSKHELNLLYLQQTVVGGFASNYYWSSTEGDNYDAWDQYFGNGAQYNTSKYNTNYVRAVRAF
jgi:hypothetical protein